MKREVSMVYKIPINRIDTEISLDTIIMLSEEHKLAHDSVDQNFGHAIECAVSLPIRRIDSTFQYGFRVDMTDKQEDQEFLFMNGAIQRYIASMEDMPIFVLKDSYDEIMRKFLRSIGYLMLEQVNGYFVSKNLYKPGCSYAARRRISSRRI